MRTPSLLTALLLACTAQEQLSPFAASLAAVR
jgi:hypothetical protein